MHAALVEAGWSERQARKGRAAVPNRVYEIMLERGVPFEHIGRKLLEHPERIEARVVGFLDDAMMRRTNKGVSAARLLGSHKRVNAFVEDQSQQVLVIQAPADWKPGQFKPSEPVPPALPPSEAEFPEYEG